MSVVIVTFETNPLARRAVAHEASRLTEQSDLARLRREAALAVALDPHGTPASLLPAVLWRAICCTPADMRDSELATVEQIIADALAH